MNKGWIKLFRDLMNHWIWQDDKYLRWWLTILLTVNHSQSKFPVGCDIFICNPGQSFRSIESWAALFGCSKKTVIKFFDQLKNDEMIERETIGKGNRRKHLLTVLNWEKYQQMETENDTETKPDFTPKRNPTLPSNKNEKERKERKNIPNEAEFLNYAKTLEVYQPGLDFSIKAKREAWLESGWKDGNGKPIKNWKTKLKNTIPYLHCIGNSVSHKPIMP